MKKTGNFSEVEKKKIDEEFGEGKEYPIFGVHG